MKCEEFEKKLLQDPYNTEAQFHQHMAECKICRAHFEEVMKLEAKLVDLFKEEVEQDFSHRLEQKMMHEIKQARHRNRRMLSMAAGVMLFVMGGLVSYHFYKIRSLTDFVLAHIDHEIEQLDTTLRVSQANLQHFFEKYDSQYLQVLQDITYVKKCWMRTGYGLHLVHQGRNGPVTLLLMPNETLNDLLTVKSERFQGKVYPMPKGSIAIVGEAGEPIELLAESVRMAM